MEAANGLAVRTAQAQSAPTPAASVVAAGTPFDPASLTDIARALAKKPFAAPAADLPAPFASLTYEQYVGIRNKPQTAQWGGDNVGFALEPLHRGFIFSTPMEINVVENGMARKLVYRSDDFDFGKLTPPANLPDLGFSGFRVLRPRRDAPGFDEVAIFQGASFFRALARGQNFGTFTRGLSIKVADQKGEEFPLFRTVWIERPSLADDALVIHALLDSESLTGAYLITLRPGDVTIVDTECTLFARNQVDNFGLGTMTAMSLFNAIERRQRDDIRPVVAEVGGLCMLTGHGEWLWRPVSNRSTLQISAFVDQNPRGFGFLQRDRDFESYQDDDQHWEIRPSLWIEPISDWGPGTVALVEIPSGAEVNQNVIAFWRPQAALAAGSETPFSYRQFWCWTPPNRPALAMTTTSRGGRAPAGAANSRLRRFLVEFAGDIFADAARSGDIVPNLTATPGSITMVRTFLSSDRKTYRVLFDLDPGNDSYSELRLVLEAQKNPVSETWLYRWTS